MADPTEDPIELVSSRHEAWRERFIAEHDRIRDALRSHSLTDSAERIEHVGSTAVPDLAAKDLVDVDIVAADDAVTDVSRALEAELGGDRFENTDEWHPIFRAQDGQRFNDHVFAASGDKWRVSVATRDVLRARAGLRVEYEQVKRGLTAEHDDLVPYSVGKTEFITRILETARDDDDLTFDFAVPTNP